MGVILVEGNDAVLVEHTHLKDQYAQPKPPVTASQGKVSDYCT